MCPSSVETYLSVSATRIIFIRIFKMIIMKLMAKKENSYCILFEILP